MPPLIKNDPQVWLDTYATARLSDILLGVITLLIGALFLWNVPENYNAVFSNEYPGVIGSWVFPSIVAGLLCVTAFVLLIRAALRRSPSVRSYSVIHLATVIVVVVATGFASWTLLQKLYLRFGPPEFMALTVLLLVLAIALGHSSRIRAAGMLFLGLLLTTIGMDTVSGLLRFTMGTEALSAGINKASVLLGLFVVGDAIVSLISVPLFLHTYTRLVTGERIVDISVYTSNIIRFAGMLVLISTPFLAYGLAGSYFDIASFFAFGIIGVAAKIFGWNRFLLYLGFAYGATLEESTKQALLSFQGNLGGFFGNFFSTTLIILTLFTIVGAAVLSVRRQKI